MIMPFEEKLDPLENGEDEGGKGANSSVEASDDQSHDKEIDTQEHVRCYHAKKATNFANRKKCWLQYPQQPIGVREDKVQGANNQIRRYQSIYRKSCQLREAWEESLSVYVMHQSSQGHLAKDKNIYIVPEMICRVFGNSKNMFMIHSMK